MENAGIDLFEAMSTLRSVRKLRPDPVPDELLKKVLTAATWAPNGGNRQGWRFLVVKDAAKKKALRDLYLPIWDAYEKVHRPTIVNLPEPERTKVGKMYDTARYLGEHYHEAPVIIVVCVRLADLAITDAKLSRPSVVGGGSIYPAVQNLMLACRASGLGATLTTLLCAEEPKVKQLFGIPDEFATAAFVPIGYPQGKGFGPLMRKPVGEVTFVDSWEKKLF